MPINRDLFETAKNPGKILIQFLKLHSDAAYTLKELYIEIPILTELKVPVQKSRDILSSMSNWDLLEVTIMKDAAYYLFDLSADQSDIDEYFDSNE
jgi:hypothetical protein